MVSAWSWRSRSTFLVPCTMRLLFASIHSYLDPQRRGTGDAGIARAARRSRDRLPRALCGRAGLRAGDITGGGARDPGTSSPTVRSGAGRRRLGNGFAPGGLDRDHDDRVRCGGAEDPGHRPAGPRHVSGLQQPGRAGHRDRCARERHDILLHGRRHDVNRHQSQLQRRLDRLVPL
jgi:hypothetical protein